jgi:hypothetical protein
MASTGTQTLFNGPSSLQELKVNIQREISNIARQAPLFFEEYFEKVRSLPRSCRPALQVYLLNWKFNW